MCLSTAYLNKKDDDCIAARYVAEIHADGEDVRLTDVMGDETVIKGKLVFADLTGGTVIIATA